MYRRLLPLKKITHMGNAEQCTFVLILSLLIFRFLSFFIPYPIFFLYIPKGCYKMGAKGFPYRCKVPLPPLVWNVSISLPLNGKAVHYNNSFFSLKLQQFL